MCTFAKVVPMALDPTTLYLHEQDTQRSRWGGQHEQWCE
jgi:hypothetical protein